MIPILVNKTDLTVTLRKDRFSYEDINLFRCYGFQWMPDGSITIPIRGTRKNALFFTMKTMFPNFQNTWDKAYLKDIYSQIKEAYGLFDSGFDKAVHDKFPPYSKLYEHQKEGVRIQCYKKYTMLSFEQGLGKTITSLVPSIIMNTAKTIIIVPASLKYNWVEEMTERWGIPKNQITVYGSKKTMQADNEKYVIINYDMLEKYFEVLLAKGFKRMIIDECHYIKNRDSKRARIVKTLVYKLGCSVSFLSGTPAPNKLIDIFSYLEISKHPHGQNYKNFLNTFCYTQMTRFGVKVTDAKNIPLLSRDIQNLIVRKLKSECLDLPDKNYIKINFESNEYDELYKIHYEELMRRIMNSGGKRSMDIQSQLNTLQVLTSKAKVKPCIELAESIMEDTSERIIDGKLKQYKKKVAICCNFVEPLKMLSEHFKEKSVLIYGAIDSDKRMDLVNAFRKMDDVQVLLGQTTCIGTGLNLTECSDVIFLNFPYTRAEIEQMSDRFHRIGQTDKVTAYFTVLVGKIDEMIYGIIVRKYRDISKLIDNVVDNTETIDVDESFIDLFSELKDKLLAEQGV